MTDRLKELAAIDLQYALLDVKIIGDRPALVRALKHARDANAHLEALLQELAEFDAPLMGAPEELR